MRNKMLKKTTLLTILSISYMFILRTLGTLYPQLFTRNILLNQCTGFFALLASLFLVLFFSFFLKEYVSPEHSVLRTATILALTGSIARLVIYLKNISFQSRAKLYSVELAILWLNSVFITIFFIAFYREHKRELPALRRASFLAILGSLCILLLHSFTLINYHLYLQRSTWFEAFMYKLILVSFPPVVFNFVTLLYFFVVYYRHLKVQGY